MDATINMTREELSLMKDLIGQEIDSVREIKPFSSEGTAEYVQTLSSLEGKFAAAV